MAQEDTIRKLSEITDEALFERLAMAILRAAKPAYATLLHPGVNPSGKTIKGPLDGIGFIAGAQPPHMVAVHHTICARADLHQKWLHDPTAAQTQRNNRITTPTGDIIKTAAVIDQERGRTPSLSATLVLTTNKEPTEDLVRNATAMGAKRGVEVDLWSVSRLADVLDFTPTGQWIRKQYLGIEQERLSKELLAKLSQDSLGSNPPNDDPLTWVARGLDLAIADAKDRDLIFIVAESGLGKSVACYKYLKAHVAAGGYGIILPHHILATALTIEQAIEDTLRRLQPPLAQGAGLEALSFCSKEQPLLVVVEDINKSGQAQFLTEKLATWSSVRKANSDADNRSTSDASGERWKLLCPVWPQIVASLRDDARKHVQQLSIIGTTFTEQEGREAIQRRARSRNISLSDLEAESVSQALGNDPLLIALHEPGRRPQLDRAIDEFIDNSVTRLATARGDYTLTDYRASLTTLARLMLSHRQLNPSWQMVLDWPIDQDGRAALRQLANHGEICRLAGNATDQHLVFRHDRVRDALFSYAICRMMVDGQIGDDVLAEPYFAEVIGAALLRDSVPIAFVDRVGQVNPLALFHALRTFREPNTTVQFAIVSAIDCWLAASETHTARYGYLRWQALAELSETESRLVPDLVRKFRDRTSASSQALFRNGDLSGGLQICCVTEPGVGAVWRDQQIEHAKLRFGSNLSTAIGQLLQMPDLAVEARIGALRLAGYLADPQLASSIEISWNAHTGKYNCLADYLWAAAQSCGGDPERYLGPICDAWAALPDETEEAHASSQRSSLAADHIRWAFRKDVPVSAIGYFIKRAKQSELTWPITYMLHGIDHPDAVEHVVRELADIERRLEGTDRFSPFSRMATEDWRRRQDEKGAPMSRQSRERLVALWQNQANDRHIREQAFRLWAATHGGDDLDVLRSVDPADTLANSVHWQRLLRRDQTAIPELITKLSDDAYSHWWNVTRAIWSDELTTALDTELERRGVVLAHEWDAIGRNDYVFYEVIMKLSPDQGEQMLVKHWRHLRFQGLYVQTALYIGTPRLLDLAQQAIAEHPEPKKIFKHISMHYGIRTTGRDGITRKEQIQALLPYLQLMDEGTIHGFWNVCNERGWFELRRNHLDSLVSRKYGGLYLDDDQIIKSIDEITNRGNALWIDHWIDDYLKTGATLDHVIGVIGGWLAARKTIGALQLAAAALTHAGRRKHLSILNVPVEPEVAAADIRTDTRFSVERRSLL